jgi:hypothetical protein
MSIRVWTSGAFWRDVLDVLMRQLRFAPGVVGEPGMSGLSPIPPLAAGAGVFRVAAASRGIAPAPFAPSISCSFVVLFHSPMSR